MKTAAASLLLATIIVASHGYSQPNIVFFLADDIGWSDFGFHGYDLDGATPTIDQLASEGVKLYAVYGGIACTPGRAAFLSGRYPMRFGLQKGAINAAQLKGIPVNESLISDEMQKAGYHTFMTGKWHVGHAAWCQTPTSRGFDKYYGFMCNGQMDFMSKTNDNYIDLYEDTDMVTDEDQLSEDVRSSWLFDAAAEDFIADHATNRPQDPFFMYYALQDPHTPLTSPSYFMSSEPCSEISDDSRLVYCGMMRCIDSSVQSLMAALSTYGYYANTLVVFSGDNGGAPKNGGYNWPLRGSKGTLYEGGIRQASWMWGSMLKDSVRGTIYKGQVHLADMLPTLMSVATGGHWAPGENKKLDGMDVWQAISSGTESPRNVTLLNVIDSSGGIRAGNWSLLYNCKSDGWYDPTSSSASNAQGYIPPPQSSKVRVTGDDYYELYNVGEDPEQYNDVAEDYPEVVAELLTMLNTYISEAVDYNVDSTKYDAAKEQAASTGYWGPWLSDCEYLGTCEQEEAAKATALNKGNLVQTKK